MAGSPYIVTQGIVLRETQTKESDKILTLLTPERGKLSVIARGVRRKSCRYAACAQALVWSEWTLYHRGDWYYVNEGATLELFSGLREDLETEMPPAFNFTTDEENKILPADGEANQVRFEFSSAYDGDLRYNPEDGRYYKWQDGEKQIDAGNDNAQLAFDNCLLLFAYIGGIANTELVDVYYAGGGEGYYFSQGRYEKISWEKPEWDGDFIFTRADGSELVLNTGTTYLAVIRDYFDDTLEIN